MSKIFTQSSYWDERYQEGNYVYGKEPNDFLFENAALFKKKDSVLCIAEGEGRNAVFLAKQGCHVSGVDFSSKGRDKALELAETMAVSIEYDLADLNHYDMGEARWDGVISIFCHPGEEERAALFRKIRRALKPGGILLFESYHKRQLDYGTGGPKDVAYLVTLDELKSAFSGYKVIHAQEVEREVSEGDYHTGLAYTTQFIVSKPSD